MISKFKVHFLQRIDSGTNIKLKPKEDVGWLVVFKVPSTTRSFRDGTPIYCPL